MQLFFMMLGAIVGLTIELSTFALLIGSITGLTIGHALRIHALNSENKQLRLQLVELNKYLKQNITAINDQLSTFTQVTSVQPETETIVQTDKPTVAAAVPTADLAKAEINIPLLAKSKTPIETTLTQATSTQPEIETVVQTDKPTVAAAVPIADLAKAEVNAPPMAKSIRTAIETTETTERPTKQPPNNVPPIESFITKSYTAIRNWLVGGNTILRVGAIILFLGLAFLLRYATEGMVFPIEARYIGIAIVGLVLIALGWRLRKKQGNYGLILQGTGVAILYLTIYAAMYLHQLLPANIVFILLVVITIASALLAILQDALSLATAAALGGFSAPLLASSGGGSHVALFCYFILLNMGILAIAWLKTWRPLNVIGFVGTFGIGFAWGIKSYTPALFWSTEPFLIIFFLMYVAIGLLFVKRKLYDAKHAPDEPNALLHWSIRQTDYIDTTVVFGAPLVGFGLQYTLINHIHYGFAISSLVLGIFYLIQAIIFHKFGTKRISLLTESCLALGIIFSSLTIPLALDAQWTSASWAVEGAAIYWVGLRQQRKLGRLFAVLLQCGAIITFFTEINLGSNTLLTGPSLGALMLGIALLCSSYQATKHSGKLQTIEQNLPTLFSVVGLSFLYLIAPFYFLQQGTAISWAIAGIITGWLGIRIKAISFCICALAVQLLAGILFALDPNLQQLGVGFSQSWYQVIIFTIFVLLLVTNTLFIVKDKTVKQYQTLFSTINIILSSGLIIIILTLKYYSGGLFAFHLVLQLMKGSTLTSQYTTTTSLVPFGHISFWTPFILALTALCTAGYLQRSTKIQLPSAVISQLSRLLLVWGACWWGLALISEITRFTTSINWQATGLLLALSSSLLVAGFVAKRFRWHDLSLATSLLIPIAFIILTNVFLTPLSSLGWLAWIAVFTVHFFNLKRLNELLPKGITSFSHITGVWLLLAVLSCALYQLVSLTSAPNSNAWYWLVWMIFPALWLLLICYKKSLPWPIHIFPKEYKLQASLPLAILLTVWFWLANTLSTGTIPAIPYIPLLNPLELGLLLALISSSWWFSKHLDNLNLITMSNQRTIKMVIGVSLFALSTAMVFRTALHWANVPFHFDAQLHSMIVQASLSILWTSIALVLMIIGHKKVYRELWLVGASLIGLVVIKLFFIELGNSGSLTRIISFTVVGLLLLIIGYFAPLPPKHNSLKQR